MTPRQQFQRYAPELVTPMDLCKKAFSGSVRWMKTPDAEQGNAGGLDTPGCVWTPYTAPRVRRGNQG